MNQLDGLKRYLEAATTLTQITRGRAEELVRDLVASGELERARAQEWIEDLVKRSREASEMLVATISSEVDRQLSERGLKNLDLDDLAQRVVGIIELAGSLGRTVTAPRVWSRGSENVAGPASSEHQGSTNGKKKSASGKGSGKKKDGSGKSPAKQGQKGSQSEKAQSKKSPSVKTHPEKAQTETAEPADRGAAT